MTSTSRSAGHWWRRVSPSCLIGAYLTLFALAQGISGRQFHAQRRACGGGRRGRAPAPRSEARRRRGPPLLRTSRGPVRRDLEDGQTAHDPRRGRGRDTAGDLRRSSSPTCRCVVPACGWRSAATADPRGRSGELRRHRDRVVRVAAPRQTVGWLEIGAPRSASPRLHERDAWCCAAFADQAAPAVAALHLHQELQRSRESLVAARETERRWLRQELHDGLGATLAGLRLQVESAQDLAEDRRADRMLTAAAGTGSPRPSREVRSIVEGLRPPGIDDLGLPRALVGLADRIETPRLDGGGARRRRRDSDHPVDPAVEVALYRIAAEALTNVAQALPAPDEPRCTCAPTLDSVAPDRRRRRRRHGPRSGGSRRRASAWSRCGNAPRRSAAASRSVLAPESAGTVVRPRCPST